MMVSFRPAALACALLLACLLLIPASAAPSASGSPAALASAPPAPDLWDDQFDEPGGAIQSTVYDLLLASSGDLYAGGTAGVLRWDGRRWHRVGANGPAGEVRALAEHGGSIYVGGRFATAGGVTVNNLARWDGSAWHPVGGGVAGAGATVGALASHNGALYAGGSFLTAGGVTVNNLARWDGSAWHSVGGGVLGNNQPGPYTVVSYAPVNELVVHQAQLYVGGAFTQTGSLPLSGLARWDGARWSSVGGPLGSNGRIVVSALISAGGALYAGGEFNLPDGAASLIARWDGATWLTIGPRSLMIPPEDLALRGGKLYAAGALPGVDPQLLAVWDGANWQRLGPRRQPERTLYALAQNATTLYVGGSIFRVRDDSRGQHTVGPVIQFRGNDWLTLGNGQYDAPRLMAVAGDGTLFAQLASGDFTSWDGTRWSNYGNAGRFDNLVTGPQGVLSISGMEVRRWERPLLTLVGQANGLIDASSIDGANLYVSGRFSEIGGTLARGLARWDGDRWFPIDTSPITGTLDPLHAGGGMIYAGVWHTQTRHSLMRWNGAAWSRMGAEFASPIYHIISHQSDLYALAGSTMYSWDGAAWQAIGTANPAAPLAILHGELIATVTPGGLSRWDGAAWQPLGDGFQQPITSLATFGNDLYVGGAFTSAGGKPAFHIARLNTNRAKLFLPLAVR